MTTSASTPISASINIQYGSNGFGQVATQRNVKLTKELQEFTVETKTIENLDETMPVQLTVTLNKNTINEYVITKPKIYSGKKTWELPGDTFESLRIPDCSTDSEDALQFQAEYRLFLDSVQTKTQLRLFNVLRNDLKCKAQLTDSQANYGDYLSFHRKYSYDDYIDIHYYWQHPTFSPGHSFEIAYYATNNFAMADNYHANCSLFIILPFVGHKRPFSISELNNPFPNEHQHETFPMIASWAAYHDFDAFYEFSYGQKEKPEETYCIKNFFYMAANPVLMTTAPIAAIMFRAFGVKTANASLSMKIPKKALFNANEKRTVKYNNLYSSKQRDLCWKPTRIEFTDEDSEDMRLISSVSEEMQKVSLMKPKKLLGNLMKKNKGIYIVNSERVKTATCHVKSIDFCSFNFSIELENYEENTATVGVTSIDMKNQKKLF